MWQFGWDHVGVTSKKMLPVVALLAGLTGEVVDEPEPDEL
jgi:hypothetical protein